MSLVFYASTLQVLKYVIFYTVYTYRYSICVTREDHLINETDLYMLN